MLRLTCTLAWDGAVWVCQSPGMHIAGTLLGLTQHTSSSDDASGWHTTTVVVVTTFLGLTSPSPHATDNCSPSGHIVVLRSVVLSKNK